MNKQSASRAEGWRESGAWPLLLIMLAAHIFPSSSARSATSSASEADIKAEEQELGVAIYGNLKAQRVIIQSSPLYDVLTPISTEIVRVAQPRYRLPMKVWLVHSAQPNAFATPGGNIFVTDELLYFVKNREQLAGTLCHEASHLIHGDSMELAEKQARLMLRELGATASSSRSGTHAMWSLVPT